MPDLLPKIHIIVKFKIFKKLKIVNNHKKMTLKIIKNHKNVIAQSVI